MPLRTCMLHQYMNLTAGQPMPLLGCQVLLCLQLPGSLSAYGQAALSIAMVAMAKLTWVCVIGVPPYMFGPTPPGQSRHSPHAQQPHQITPLQ